MELGINLLAIKNYANDLINFTDSCKLLKDIGFKYFTCSFFNIDYKKLKKASKESKVNVTLIDMNYEHVCGDPLVLMKELASLGINNVGVSIPLEILKNEKKYKKVIASLDEVAKILNQNGYKIHYHFTQNEFSFFQDGTRVIDYLIDKALNIYFVFSPFYVIYSGLSLQTYFLKMKGRIDYLYLKDYKIALENNKFVPVSTSINKGNLNFKEIFLLAKKAGVKNYVLALDSISEYVNPFLLITNNFEELNKIH